jgi:ATP adenylyltransferase
MAYIEKHHSESGCILCEVLDQSDSPDNLIVWRGSRVYVILNRFPYTSGHLMIVPYDHLPSLHELDPETRSEIIELADRAVCVLQEAYHPQGFNLGINLGEAAGAGITEHVHLHVVPRWMGDTNFMSTLGGTRVLPESLADTYQRIRQAWLRQST